MVGHKVSWAVGAGLVAVLVVGGCGDDAVVGSFGGVVSFDADGSPKSYLGAVAQYEASFDLSVVGTLNPGIGFM